MLTKERETLEKAARGLHGAVLIEVARRWRRGEADDAALLKGAQDALARVAELRKSIQDMDAAPPAGPAVKAEQPRPQKKEVAPSTTTP